MIRISVPATSANLGPGFDCLGLALNLYNTIIIEEDKPFEIKLTGDYTDYISTDKTNLVWKTMSFLWDKIGYSAPNVAITLENQVPPARGLGSSSTAIVGGLIGANILAGSPLSKEDLIQLANELEGHPDNITPAFLGGVTLSIQSKEKMIPRLLSQSPKLSAVAVVPELLLKTDTARNVLAPQVNRSDAVYNIAHTGLIIEAFIREDYSLLKEGMLDKLHQEKRSTLIPGMFDAIDSALNAGAYGAALSGSGPTLLALTHPNYESKIGEAMVNVFRNYNVNAKAYLLNIDSFGAQVVVEE